MIPDRDPPVEFRYGWVMVAITPVFTGIGNGGVHSLSVFLKPLSAELGWLRGETAFAYLAGTMAVGIGGVLMGHLADRYTTRRVVVPGILVLSAGYLALSLQTALWQFYALYVVLGGLGAASLFSPLLANVGRWFAHRKGLALGITTAGQALAQGGVPYLVSFLIASVGWRAAFTALAVAALAVLLPLSLLIRESPSSMAARSGRRSAGPGGEASPLRPAHLISLLSLAAIFCCITMAAPLVHVVALASDRGLGAESAARTLLLIMVAGVFGRISFGRLADRIGGLPAYMVASAWQTVLVFWFTRVESPFAFHLLALVFGFGYSGVMTCLTYCAQRFVPAAHTGFATGIVGLFGWLGMGVGGFQAGFFFDRTGNYSQSFANAVVAGVINLALLTILLIVQSKRRATLPVETTSA